MDGNLREMNWLENRKDKFDIYNNIWILIIT